MIYNITYLYHYIHSVFCIHKKLVEYKDKDLYCVSNMSNNKYWWNVFRIYLLMQIVSQRPKKNNLWKRYPFFPFIANSMKWCIRWEVSGGNPIKNIEGVSFVLFFHEKHPLLSYCTYRNALATVRLMEEMQIIYLLTNYKIIKMGSVFKKFNFNFFCSRPNE